MHLGVSTTSSEIANLLNEHIRALKLLQAKLERLSDLRQKGKVSRSLYNSIIDEVRLRIELFGTEKDLLMILLDENIRLLERTEDESIFVDTALEERFEVLEEQEAGPFEHNSVITSRVRGKGKEKICLACGVSNPTEANFCVSCASKLPSLEKVDEIWNMHGFAHVSKRLGRVV